MGKYILYFILALCVLSIICTAGYSYETEHETNDNLVTKNDNNANIENDTAFNEISLNTENEEEFKLKCEELVFKDIDKNTIGKYVTKELIFDGGTIQDGGYTLYECGATEDFLEELGVYQKTYNVYRIKDYRIDKDFPIEGSDVMRIYGIVEDVSKSYKTGNYNPTINIYYAEYIRKYGEKAEDAKSEEEIKKEREENAKESEYKEDLNSDYTGISKNISNMDEMALVEYMMYCDAMNFKDIVNSNEDFTGRYVKLHVQVVEHKKFKNDEGKTNRLGEWVEIENVQDDVWYCKLYNEQSGEYVYSKSKLNTIYFLDTESIDASILSKGDKIVVYGQLVKHNDENGEFEMLVRYYEKE